RNGRGRRPQIVERVVRAAERDQLVEKASRADHHRRIVPDDDRHADGRPRGRRRQHRFDGAGDGVGWAGERGEAAAQPGGARAGAASATARPASSVTVIAPATRSSLRLHATMASSRPTRWGRWAKAKSPPPTERRWGSVCAQCAAPPSLPRGIYEVARTETSPG